MKPEEFVKKWSKVQQKEISASQSHFNDVCLLVGHKLPLDTDPVGEFFTFEQPTEKATGDRGRADVWYDHRFIWEYKGHHIDLDKAYQQLLLYRESLGNPPLLITSDMEIIIIHTNFTDTSKKEYEIRYDEILDGSGVKLLKRAFYEPNSFEPTRTQQQVTQATADAFVKVTEALQNWDKEVSSEKLAHFIIRLLFCLFAEDMKLLPDNVFTTLVSTNVGDLEYFVPGITNLFNAMREGGLYGTHKIPYFDGGLFNDNFIPTLPTNLQDILREAGKLDWSGIDPSIFGTLFERVIDDSKRAKLGAHYTSKEDIMLIVEPVLMQPLREEWQETKQEANKLIDDEKSKDAQALLLEFSDKIAGTRVLDPACGSGNFLYVALRQLLDLQKEIIQFAGRNGLDDIPLSVNPAQLYGIEINPYAHELAQTTVWIGYIQWRNENGFPDFEEPILQPLNNIELKDAILAYDTEGNPADSEWPVVDFIIGNPPFLGNKKLIFELGEKYVTHLRKLYHDKISRQSDLVCYWFEKARSILEDNMSLRIGLLATNSIRGGANRIVLDEIKETGDIFWAESNRNWILEGAAVNVSMIGFGPKNEDYKILDGFQVNEIYSDLTSDIDLTIAKTLKENSNIAFQGTIKAGPFDINFKLANEMLNQKGNPNNRPNSDVIRPWINGSDIVKRARNMWIIDFGTNMSQANAAKYLSPFEHVQNKVYPKRKNLRRENHRRYWWIHAESRPGMRLALNGKSRYIVTPRVSKYRVFIFQDIEVLPDSAVVTITRDDYYFLGALESKLHELWSLRKGTSLEDRPRYTPTSTFETFPFPWPPELEPNEDEDERVKNIAEAARQLVNFRQPWLFPPEGELSGPKMLKKRTLTNLYNALAYYRDRIKGKQRNQTKWNTAVKRLISLEDIETLDHIHDSLDKAVLDAYGWPHNLTDEQILERLLALNLERADGEEE